MNLRKSLKNIFEKNAYGCYRHCDMKVSNIFDYICYGK